MMPSQQIEKVNFPVLYKKTNTGAIQFWDIFVRPRNIPIEGMVATYQVCAEIVTTYGQLGTDSPQETVDLISNGKNVGKKNETTPWTQALAEAKAKWEKQLKKGYVESIEAAQAGEVDDLIEGGINPMLAQAYKKHSSKIKFPAFVQPKLDGIRCIAMVKNGICTLWSRTRKRITSMPHIVEEIENVFKGQNIILDGELYNHDYKANFEHIVSLVRQEEPDERHTDVQYHIYDTVTEGSFGERIQVLFYKLFCHEEKNGKLSFIRTVETVSVENEDHSKEAYANWRLQGFEGAMIRNSDSLYEYKRSYGLQKIKEFDDGEFEIIGVEEGRGKLSGHVGAFICRMENGKEFLAKMSGNTEKLKEYFNNSSLWQGKKLTVQYQGLTGAEGVPRFPVGVVIRDYE